MRGPPQYRADRAGTRRDASTYDRGQDIGRAQELRGEPAIRPLVDLRRASPSGPAARSASRRSGRHGQCLLLIVRDQDERDIQGRCRRTSSLRVASRRSRSRAESGSSSSSSSGSGARAPGQRHPLLLAAGELIRPAALEPLQPDQSEHSASTRRATSLARDMPRWRRPKPIFPATDICGNSAYD